MVSTTAAVDRVQFIDGVVTTVVRHPDVGAVGGDATGSLPTPMVWTTEPVEASSSVTVLSRRSSPRRGCRRRRTEGRVAHVDGLDDRPGRGVELGHRVVGERSPPRRGCRRRRRRRDRCPRRWSGRPPRSRRRARSLLSPEFATQTWVPSEEMPWGAAHADGLDDRPGRGVELGHRVVAVFATQTWVPSEETPSGSLPTPMVWTTDARSRRRARSPCCRR